MSLHRTDGFALILVFMCIFFSAQPSRAMHKTLQLHGFGSQGFVQSSGNNFFGMSTEGSFKYHELGMGGSIQPLPDLQFSVQGLSRRAGEGDQGKVRLDYGFLDYRVVSTEAYSGGLRIGRMQIPLGLYNDTPRDVAFTRPSIFLPQSIYFDRTQNLARSADGIHLYAEDRTTVGDFFLQMGTARAEVNGRETQRALLGTLPGQLKSRTSYISRLLYERDGGRVRVALTGTWLNLKFDSSEVAPKEGTIRFRPIIFSAQYNAEKWSLTSEYALRNSRYRNVGPLNFNINGESYYLQATYRLVEDLELLLRYDVLFQDRKDRSGNAWAANFPGSPNHSRFAKDATIGFRWDFSRIIMARIEYHYVDGTAWVTALDNPPPRNAARYWDLFSVLLSFRFQQSFL